MANMYAADFGDVVKHAVLCEVFVLEQPSRYLESHGGRLDCDLSGIEPGPGGVWDFIELSADFDALAASAYSRIVVNRSQNARTDQRVARRPSTLRTALLDALHTAGMTFGDVEQSARTVRRYSLGLGWLVDARYTELAGSRPSE